MRSGFAGTNMNVLEEGGLSAGRGVIVVGIDGYE